RRIRDAKDYYARNPRGVGGVVEESWHRGLCRAKSRGNRWFLGERSESPSAEPVICSSSESATNSDSSAHSGHASPVPVQCRPDYRVDVNDGFRNEFNAMTDQAMDRRDAMRRLALAGIAGGGLAAAPRMLRAGGQASSADASVNVLLDEPIARIQPSVYGQ